MKYLEGEFLQKTNDLIEQRLSIRKGELVDDQSPMAQLIARHLCAAPSAKRARPLVSLYYHWLFDEKTNEFSVPLGVAAEFIHAASLLHDDVVDEAHKRRGLASANAVFGNAQAVLAGNFLLTQAFDLLRPLKREFIDKAIIVVREMTLSAMLEIECRGRLDVSQNSWYAVARGKTGVLFSWCGWAAAINSNKIEDAERLWSLGFSIGNIFQMVDDLKDFSGDGDLKEVAKDIRNKESSLPVLIAINSDEKIKKQFSDKFVKDVLSDEDVAQLRHLVLASNAIEDTKTHIQKELSRVKDCLSIYEGSRGKAALDGWMRELAG